MTNQHDDTLSGDRGPIAPRPGAPSANRQQMIMAAAVIGGGVLAGGYVMLAPNAPPTPPPKKAAAVQATVTYQAPPTLAVMTPLAATAPAPTPPVAVAAAHPMPPTDPTLEAAYRAPVLAFSLNAPPAPPVATGAVLAAPRVTDDNGGLERRLTPSRFDVAKAGQLGDRRFIVAQGTSIPCILETAMQSDQPGFVSCIIPRDVLSDNGQVVLMEKGTQVVGEYRGGLNQGQTRLHVLWGRAKTPTGVVVTLASAATDGLGRAGVGGTIDNHWWERFGSALLLSVVADGSAAGSTYLKNQAGINAQQAGQSGNQAAAIAVEQSAAIKPTLHKNQGEMVSIFVARDLDFSGVYQLRVVDWRTAPAEVSILPAFSGRPLK
jgi:type IV secretion system protein VirB10